jgi:hypothetical protein
MFIGRPTPPSPPVGSVNSSSPPIARPVNAPIRLRSVRPRQGAGDNHSAGRGIVPTLRLSVQHGDDLQSQYSRLETGLLPVRTLRALSFEDFLLNKRGHLRAAHFGRRVVVLDPEVRRYLAEASSVH